MITVAILDDEKMYLERERCVTEEYFRRKGIECQVEAFQDADWMLSGLEEEKFDIYVLDVEMPVKTGLEVAKEIRKVYPDPVIIFVTNYVDYAVDAYELNTWRYIPKEVYEEKLVQAYDALLPEILEREEKYYIVKKKLNIEKIPYDQILYLKKDGRYTVIVHRNGESRVRESLANMLEELNSPEFLFIDKGIIVNIQHVMGMKDYMIRMRDGTRLPVGAARAHQVIQKISEYWRC